MTTKKSKKPAYVPNSNTIRLSFKLDATKDQEARTTSVSLKSEIVSFWLFNKFCSPFVEEKFLIGPKKLAHSWKKELYDFLGPRIKEEYLKNPKAPLSTVALNILLYDILEIFGVSPKEFRKIEVLNSFVSASIKNPNIVLDLNKGSKGTKKKVKKVKRVKVKKPKK